MLGEEGCPHNRGGGFACAVLQVLEVLALLLAQGDVNLRTQALIWIYAWSGQGEGSSSGQ